MDSRPVMERFLAVGSLAAIASAARLLLVGDSNGGSLLPEVGAEVKAEPPGEGNEEGESGAGEGSDPVRGTGRDGTGTGGGSAEVDDSWRGDGSRRSYGSSRPKASMFGGRSATMVSDLARGSR